MYEAGGGINPPACPSPRDVATRLAAGGDGMDRRCSPTPALPNARSSPSLEEKGQGTMPQALICRPRREPVEATTAFAHDIPGRPHRLHRLQQRLRGDSVACAPCLRRGALARAAAHRGHNGRRARSRPTRWATSIPRARTCPRAARSRSPRRRGFQPRENRAPAASRRAYRRFEGRMPRSRRMRRRRHCCGAAWTSRGRRRRPPDGKKGRVFRFQPAARGLTAARRLDEVRRGSLPGGGSSTSEVRRTAGGDVTGRVRDQ